MLLKKEMSAINLRRKTLCFLVVAAGLFPVAGCKLLLPQGDDPILALDEPPAAKPSQPPAPQVEEPQQPEKKKSLWGSLFTKKEKTSDDEPSQSPPEPVVPKPESPDDAPVVSKVPMGLDESSKITVLEQKLQVGDNVGIALGMPIDWSSSDKIDLQGNVNLPIIGAFSAAGKTTSELEKGISEVYVEREIVRNYLHVTVTTAVKSYYIQGEVRSPGRFPLTPPMTLTKAVAAAGGTGPWANKKKVRVQREKDVYDVDFDKILKNPRLDIEILPNDLITVPKDRGPLGLGRE